MNDRTCPFCGGVQSESRCEICNRPTIKITTQASPVQSIRYDSSDKKIQSSNVSAVDNPYLKQIHEKRLQHKQGEHRKFQQAKQNNAMRIANTISFIVFFFIFALIFFLAF